MKPLQIKLQHLVSSTGETCERCKNTHQNVINSLEKLKSVLNPLNIEPVLEIKEINSYTFKDDPTQSNRIWINEKPLEEWLKAQVSSSCCDSVCNNADCRTLQINNQTYETIPVYLIIKACMLAAVQLIDTDC